VTTSEFLKTKLLRTLKQLHNYCELGDYVSMWQICKTNSINPTFVFDCIPDEQKYDVIVAVHTHEESPKKSLNKYLNAIKSLIPSDVAESVADHVDSDGNVTVYRGGVLVKNPALCPSWTLDFDVAEWFAKRFLFMGDTVLYKGLIKANDIIAYVQDRGEEEIIQHRGVNGIEVIRNYNKGEYVPEDAES